MIRFRNESINHSYYHFFFFCHGCKQFVACFFIILLLKSSASVKNTKNQDLWTARVKRIFGELSRKASSRRVSSHFIDRSVDRINSLYLSSRSIRKLFRWSDCQALFNLAEDLVSDSDAFTIQLGLSSAMFCWSTIHFSYRYENHLGTSTQIVHSIV